MHKILHFNELPISAFFFFLLFRTLQYLDIIMQQTYRIFLASSYELKADREQFEIFINRQNNLLRAKGVFLQLVLWEDIGGEVYETHKQDHYNEELKTCDVFVMLYWSKVGIFTNIEFDRALAQFRYTSRHPKMYVFEKAPPMPATQTPADKESLEAFKRKLREAGQFPIQYRDDAELTFLFKSNLDKLFAEGYLIEGTTREPAKLLYSDGNSVPVGFIGRESELKTIRQKLDKGGSLMLINAEGGIGKTSLAAKYWEESQYDYKYNAWLFCESGIVSTIKKLATGLGVDLAGLNEEQQTEALKRAIMLIAKDMLLVLDNANNADDIKEFIKVFRGFSWHVLLTSRCNDVLERAQELHIDHLPPDMAKELFQNNYREETPEFEELLDRLLAAIGYHTLLTELFSKNLAKLKGTGETLEKFLNDLETKGLFLKKRSFDIPTDYTLNRHVDATDTDSIIEILYDFTALEELERYYLVNIALLPAVNYELKFLVQLFEPIELIDLQRVLQSLYKEGWLGYTENGYRISPVVQQLVSQKNTDTLEKDSRRLLLNLCEKLGNDGVYLTNLAYSEAAQFAQLVPAITGNIGENYFDLIGNLNDRVYIYYRAVGDLLEAQRAAEKYREISQSLKNKIAVSVCYERSGDIARDFGDLNGALDFYKKSLKLKRQLYRESPNDPVIKNTLAVAYNRLGDVQNSLGYADRAVGFFIKYHQLREELYIEYPTNELYKNGLAISYQRLGDAKSKVGDLEKALIFYKKGNELNEQLYIGNPDNINIQSTLGISYHKLGNVYLEWHDFNKALDFFLKFNNIFEKLYSNNHDNVGIKNGLAVSYYNMATACQKNKSINTAKELYQKAAILWRELINTCPQMQQFWKNLSLMEKEMQDLDGQQ